MQISSGLAFDCGITSDQELHCWGDNKIIGGNRQIPGLYKQVAVDEFFGCGILLDGRIQCFGKHTCVDI